MSEKKENLSAFGGTFVGGPHGLGDPEDRTMRRLEDQVFINQMVKDHAHHTVCKDVIKKWGECMEDNGHSFNWQGFTTFWTCRPQVNEMNNCLSKYYKDPDFREEVTQIYLDRRARYRATGIMEKDPYVKKKYYVSDRKAEFLEQIKHDRQEKEKPKD